jgi:hypothetical protein
MSKTLDLNKVKDIIFSDIFKLLDSFNLEYTQDMDNIFMCCPCHEGSDNPNGVSISLDKQMWRCWTRGCNSEYNSDIFGFIRGVLSQREGQEPTFSEILKYVCKIYDVNNASKEKKNGNNDRNNSDLDDSNDFSALVTRINRKRAGRREYQAEVPIELPPRSSAVSKYFQARGFSAEVLSTFGVYDSAALRRAIIKCDVRSADTSRRTR